MREMTERVILHSDLNNFYASVEMLCRPELRGKPLAVVGDPEARHGIVLAKNEQAKQCNVRTGEPLWQAKQKCPDIIFVQPRFGLYAEYSARARRIYESYTDLVEPFGMDECWLDVTGSALLFGSGERIANEIRRRMREELGLTVSVGVSFNKVFAKLGSDLHKPDATTVITTGNFRDIVWQLPVNELLYVGGRTYEHLKRSGIFTIGHLAQTDPRILQKKLGKTGIMLWRYANGMDLATVAPADFCREVKSVGNSTTTPRDLVHIEEIRLILLMLSESVSARLREQGLQCRTVQLGIRDSMLHWTEHQGKLTVPNRTVKSIYEMALALYLQHGNTEPVRSLSVRACDLETSDTVQLSFFTDTAALEQEEQLETTVDALRRRFGNRAIQRGILLTDHVLSECNVTGQGSFS